MKKFPENKIEPKKRARFIEACNAQIPLVCYIFIKDAEIPALLARDITYGIAGSGRNSVYCGECDMLPEKNIQYAAGISPPRASSFQNKAHAFALVSFSYHANQLLFGSAAHTHMRAHAQVRKNTQTQAPENRNFRPLYPAAAACGIVSVTALFCMYHAASAITIIGHPFPICKETFPTVFREFHRAFLLLTEKFLEILNQIPKEDEIILLCDIIGGSPFTSSAELLRQEGFLERSLILTGMNMPVLVQLLLQKDDSALEQLKSEVKAISAGTIQIFEEESEDEDEEL